MGARHKKNFRGRQAFSENYSIQMECNEFYVTHMQNKKEKPFKGTILKLYLEDKNVQLRSLDNFIYGILQSLPLRNRQLLLGLPEVVNPKRKAQGLGKLH